MSSVAVEVSSRVRLSDPKPAYCSGCYAGADENIVFVDFDAAYDAGSVIDNESQSLVHSLDDLHLCEACVRAAAELLKLKPELHARQRREIRRLEIENEHWRDYSKTLERTLEQRPAPELRSA